MQPIYHRHNALLSTLYWTDRTFFDDLYLLFRFYLVFLLRRTRERSGDRNKERSLSDWGQTYRESIWLGTLCSLENFLVVDEIHRVRKQYSPSLLKLTRKTFLRGRQRCASSVPMLDSTLFFSFLTDNENSWKKKEDSWKNFGTRENLFCKFI